MQAAPLLDSGWIGLLEGRDLNIRACMDGLFGGNRRSARNGTSTEFTDFREYVPGDDPRRIDWNLYGRFDQLYLRLYADERRQRHQVMLDTSASMAWGSPEKIRTALQLASLLGYLAISSLDTVTFFALRGDQCKPVTEMISNRDAWYAATAQLNQLRCGGETEMDRAVASCPTAGWNDGITFLISDFLTDSDWKAGVDWLLSRKREVCLIRILSPDEIAPSLCGRTQLIDMEAIRESDRRNRRMDISRQRLEAYAEACAWLEKDIKHFCASRGVRLLTFSTADDLMRVLFADSVEAGMIV